MITKRERLEAMAREWRQYADSHSGERAETFAHCSRVLLEALRGAPVPHTTLMADRPEQAPRVYPSYCRVTGSVVPCGCRSCEARLRPEQAPQGGQLCKVCLAPLTGFDTCPNGHHLSADTTKPEEPR